jgi:hypothetical protein
VLRPNSFGKRCSRARVRLSVMSYTMRAIMTGMNFPGFLPDRRVEVLV